MKKSEKKLGRNKVLLLWAAFMLIALLTACSSAPITSPSKTTSATTLSSTPTNQQPIEVVSLTGPLPPVNPGGPNVEIILKNISTEPIVTLNVTLELNKPFNFVFDVSLPVPVLPGKTISTEQTLISGGFSESTLYPLRISGTFRNGSTFDYVKQIQIMPSPTKS